MPPPQVDYSGTNTSLWVTLVVLLIVVVIGYVSFHAYAYHRCIITPGILDWPDKCF